MNSKRGQRSLAKFAKSWLKPRQEGKQRLLPISSRGSSPRCPSLSLIVNLTSSVSSGPQGICRQILLVQPLTHEPEDTGPHAWACTAVTEPCWQARLYMTQETLAWLPSFHSSHGSGNISMWGHSLPCEPIQFFQSSWGKANKDFSPRLRV